MLHAASRLARPAALLLVAAVATACVGTAGAAEPSATPAPDPDRIVFRVDQDGGFVPPGVVLGRLPVVTVYADGRVVTAGPQIEVYPGPLVPALQVRTLTPEALDRLVALARELDLLRDAHFDFPLIADATTTVLTVNVDGATYRYSAYALGEAGTDEIPADDAGVDRAAVAGREALRSFIDALAALPDADFAGPWAVYEPQAMRVFAGPAGPRPDDLPAQPVVDWPLGDLGAAGSPVGDGSLGFRCQVLDGDDLATAGPVLAAANQLTVFASGGDEWSLVVRPLLPGESGC